MQRTSRRQFLKDVGIAVGGLVLASSIPKALYADTLPEAVSVPENRILVELNEDTGIPQLIFRYEKGIKVIKEQHRNPKLYESPQIFKNPGLAFSQGEFIEEEKIIKEIAYPVVIGLDNDKYRTIPGNFEVVDIDLGPDWVVPKDKNGNYAEWVKPEHRKIADENGGIIPYGNKENPLGEFKVRLRNIETGKIEEQMIHGNGGYYIERGIWRYSHSCIRMKDEDGIEMIGFLQERFPITIGPLYA